MPVISKYLDFKIVMYCFPKEHFPAHIHIYIGHNNLECRFKIPEGELLDGRTPVRTMKLIKDWINIHSNELMKMWEKAVNGERPGIIEND